MVGIYFSGTGNTRYCVEKFLNEVDENAKSYSIEDENCIAQIQNNKTIIFGYPTYYSNIPKIVKDFIIQNSSVWKDKEIYIIDTMGLFSGDGAGILGRLLTKYGSKIIGGLHLKMPDNICDVKLLKKDIDHNKDLVKKADEKVKTTAQNFKNGNISQDGLGLISHLAGLFGQRLYFYNATKNYSDKLKIDKQKCIGCELCASVCPMKNIELKENKAVSSNKCTLCYRCVNQCPTQAITLLGKEVIQQGTIEKYLK